MDDNPELLMLSLAWPVTAIDGTPTVTHGSVTVMTAAGGEYLLEVTSGDERHPDGEYVQVPLSRAQADLVRRALGGETIGDVRS